MSIMIFAPSPYPMDAFFVLVRETGFEIHRNVQAPDAMIGMALVSAMTMACQALIDVKLPTGQVRPVTQNVMVIAESGDRKTTVDGLLYAPFRDHDMQALVLYKAALETYQAERDWWESKNNGLRRAIAKSARKSESADEVKAEMAEHAKSKPKMPRRRILMRQDITARAIMEVLEGDGESIAIATDEGQVLFKSGAMTNLGLLNRVWDSPNVLSLDRADLDQVMVMNPRVSISIMTQPDVLKAYLEKRGSVAKGSGHWARYLVGWPVSTRGFRWVNSNEAVWEHLPAFQVRIKELLAKQEAMYESGAVEREIIEFTDDAKVRWFAQAGKTEWMLRPGDYLDDINDFGSKAMEIVARLAAVLHYFGGEAGKITVDTLERAISIVSWHVDEYKRLFSPQFTLPQDQLDAQAVAAYLRNHIWQGPGSNSFVAKNHLLRNGPVRGRDRLDPALKVLEHQGAICIVVAPKDKKRYVQLNNNHFGAI
ncbi:YfjI family protein [Stenotrophomonas lacuserhaii]|uniref:YfjI family protein n=1 Tax=Stenotrophomonas lacuserhaii TaxID=2760084 RepID=UPI0015F84577|nr:YfjI family protein [Stenotrophomonas lacuserhaii]